MPKTVTRVAYPPRLMRKKRVAAYCRVSSGKDAMLHSLSAQVSYYNNLIQKEDGGTHYIKKVSHRTLIFQVLCCFLLFLLHFCHMALKACFHIFGIKRFDDTYAVVVDVDNLIPLSVKVVGG